MATVTIAQGKLKGGESKTDSGFQYYEFLGIPYAKSPIGNLRFKSPQPPESWENERDATTSHVNNIALQIGFLNGEFIGSEDCLYLNVFTPKLPTSDSKPLPVMVYIHGGGFIHGTGIIKSESGPDFLIENNVVVVSINYRIGVLGFLSLDIPEAAGNMGLKDQVKALEWIKTNIVKFGGDKENVTIFGISAGSASVEYLMLSPLARGLFHKAILQSGSSTNDWAINFQPKRLVLQLVEQLGYKGRTDDNRAIYEFLLNIPGPLLTRTAFQGFQQLPESFNVNSIYFGFVPTIEKDTEGAFLTANPYKLLKEGNFSRVPIIRGFCDTEGFLMSIMKPVAVKELTDTKNFAAYWSYGFEGNDKEKYNAKLLNAYLENIKPDDELDKFAVDFLGDLQFSAGVWIAAKLIASKGVPTYVYKFSYDGNFNLIKTTFGLTRKGAAHGDDTGYVFRNDTMKTGAPNEIDKLVRSRVTKMWTNFAKTGKPTPSRSSEIPVNWPRFTEASPAYLNINKEFTIDVNYEPNKMAVFEEIYEKYEK